MSLFPVPFHVGFTGTQEGMTSKQKKEVEHVLGILQGRGYVWFHHGDCVGSDAEAAQIARALKYKIHCHPPVNDRARAFEPYNRIEEPLGYLERNRKIVEASNFLLATPRTIEEELRSGTWSTIRHARKLKVNHKICLPT